MPVIGHVSALARGHAAAISRIRFFRITLICLCMDITCLSTNCSHGSIYCGTCNRSWWCHIDVYRVYGRDGTFLINQFLRFID